MTRQEQRAKREEAEDAREAALQNKAMREACPRAAQVQGEVDRLFPVVLPLPWTQARARWYNELIGLQALATDAMISDTDLTMESWQNAALLVQSIRTSVE